MAESLLRTLAVALSLLYTLPCVLAFPSFTHTHGYTVGTSEICTTSYAPTSAKRAVPTYSSKVTLRAQVIIIITNSLPAETITPLPATLTETSNTYTEVTTTLDAVTDTFFSTSTELSTTTTEVTTTDLVTETETALVTETNTITIPTPAGFRSVADSALITNYTGSSPKLQVQKQRPNLELRDADASPEDQMGWVMDDGAVRPFAQYPGAVNCNQYLKPTWTEVIALIRHSVTVTVPQSTSTTTVLQTITSTSTEAPSVSTTRTTTITSFTTDTSYLAETATSTSTTSITATVSNTEYDACKPSNIIGPHVEIKGTEAYLQSVQQFPNQAQVPLSASDGLVCCELCQAHDFCVYGAFFTSFGICLLTLDETGTCDPGKLATRIGWGDTSYYLPVFSNGPCGYVEAWPNKF